MVSRARRDRCSSGFARFGGRLIRSFPSTWKLLVKAVSAGEVQVEHDQARDELVQGELGFGQVGVLEDVHVRVVEEHALERADGRAIFDQHDGVRKVLTGGCVGHVSVLLVLPVRTLTRDCGGTVGGVLHPRAPVKGVERGARLSELMQRERRSSMSPGFSTRRRVLGPLQATRLLSGSVQASAEARFSLAERVKLYLGRGDRCQQAVDLGNSW